MVLSDDDDDNNVPLLRPAATCITVEDDGTAAGSLLTVKVQGEAVIGPATKEYDATVVKGSKRKARLVLKEAGQPRLLPVLPSVVQRDIQHLQLEEKRVSSRAILKKLHTSSTNHSIEIGEIPKRARSIVDRVEAAVSSATTGRAAPVL